MSGGMDCQGDGCYCHRHSRYTPTAAPTRLCLWIPGVFPGMNEITKAAKSGRGKGNGYSRMKAACDLRVMRAVNECFSWAPTVRPFPKIGRAAFFFTWHEIARRRDPDNISAGVKFILDGLVKAGVFPNDGWNEVSGIIHRFRVTPDRPGVEVEIEEVIA